MCIYLRRNGVSGVSDSICGTYNQRMCQNFTLLCERNKTKDTYTNNNKHKKISIYNKYIEQQVDSLISLNSIARVHWIIWVDCCTQYACEHVCTAHYSHYSTVCVAYSSFHWCFCCCRRCRSTACILKRVVVNVFINILIYTRQYTHTCVYAILNFTPNDVHLMSCVCAFVSVIVKRFFISFIQLNEFNIL